MLLYRYAVVIPQICFCTVMLLVYLKYAFVKIFCRYASNMLLYRSAVVMPQICFCTDMLSLYLKCAFVHICFCQNLKYAFVQICFRCASNMLLYIYVFIIPQICFCTDMFSLFLKYAFVQICFRYTSNKLLY